METNPSHDWRSEFWRPKRIDRDVEPIEQIADTAILDGYIAACSPAQALLSRR
jgi:hypothetical protein